MPDQNELKIAIDALDTRIQELKHTLTTIDTLTRREDGGDGSDPRGDLQLQLNALLEQRAAKVRELEGA